MPVEFLVQKQYMNFSQQPVIMKVFSENVVVTV